MGNCSLLNHLQLSSQPHFHEVGGTAVYVAENAVLFDLGKIIFDNSARDVRMIAVNTYGLYNLGGLLQLCEGCCVLLISI